MPDQKPKILVFMLSRTGCIPYATNMVNALYGFEKYIFVSRYSPEMLPKDNHKIRTYRNSLEFVFNSLIGLPWLCIKVRKLVKTNGFQVAYFPVFHHWNPVLLFWCKIWGLEVVFTVHDGVLHQGEQSSRDQKMLNFCIRKADKLVFLSRYVQELTREKTGFAAKTCIIPHPLLRIGSPVIKDRHLPERPSLLFLGRIVEYKGVDLLLEALNGFSRDRLGQVTIAGQNYSGFKPDKMGAVSVNWIGRWLEDTEIDDLLNSHDILVLPYREASQSGIVTLGIGAAIPMICTNVGGLPEQLTKEQAVFTRPEVFSLKKAILDLINDPERYRNIHQNLLARARSGEGEYAGRLATFLTD